MLLFWLWRLLLRRRLLWWRWRRCQLGPFRLGWRVGVENGECIATRAGGVGVGVVFVVCISRAGRRNRSDLKYAPECKLIVAPPSARGGAETGELEVVTRAPAEARGNQLYVIN